MWRGGGASVSSILNHHWAGLILPTGDKGVEYPERFFARDYAGNRLEFSI